MIGRKRGIRVRCSRAACQARRTLRQDPDLYLSPPPCRYCGNRKYRVDVYRHKVELKRRCFCDAYWFPHRPGSGDCQHENC